ncbi:Ankyrin repeat-containing protein [Spironucleus salmonicida]|uniref:Ankyrin repeat-containing protein n=1 Tax=Spironucleus salmonicida TaxID=348837 RepID=V6LPW4_9EUKA|nr:Ankyrin repeat-containing protein [Spironucleus salmonicida]|eukprot:EST45751.1 Ankyrin repeat-containing protein [Spironucleus salmonicida]
MSSLITAVKQQNIKKVHQHLDQMGQRGDYNQTALMLAAKLNFIEAVEILVQQPPQIKGFRATFEVQSEPEIKLTDSNGLTALMHAVQANNIDAAKILVKFESNERDFSGLTALMQAAIRNLPAMCDILDSEANHQINGKTALLMAVEQNSIDVLPALIPLEAGKFPHTSNVEFGPMAVFSKIQEFLNDGVIIKSRDILDKMNNQPKLWSALMLAGVNGNIQMVQMLANKEKGMQCPCYGETALMRVLACLGYFTNLIRVGQVAESTYDSLIKSYVQIALFLCEIDEEVTKQDKQGKSALMSAVMCWNYGYDIVLKLIPLELNLVDQQGLTCAAYCCDDDKMLQILEAYINEQQNKVDQKAVEVEQNQ